MRNLKKSVYNLLRRTEKFTGTDNVYLAKQGTYLNLNNIVMALLALGLSVAYARLLPKDTYGEYKYILSFFGFFSIAALQGLDNALIRGIARGAEKTFSRGLALRFRYSLLGSLAAALFAFYFWFQGNPVLAGGFFIRALFLPLMETGRTYALYLEGKKEFGREVGYGLITSTLSALAVILTISLTEKLLPLVLVYFLAHSLLRMYFLKRTIRLLPPNKQDDPETISYGKHLSLMGVLGLASRQLDKILLFHFLGAVQLAVYSFAVAPVEQLRSPFQSLQRLALPKFSLRTKEEIKKNLPKKIWRSLVFVTAAVLFYNLVADPAYRLFFPQYLDSIFYSRLFSLSLFIFPITMIALSLQAQMMKRQLYWLSVISPVFDIATLLVLTPLYGILGVILARLSSQIFYALLVVYFFRKM